MTRPFADHALAARLEAIAARDLVLFGETAARLYPDREIEWIRVGDGAALWMGDGSPLNVAVGLGLTGPVTNGDLIAVEDFYACRSSRTSVAVCPLADATLREGLARRGYVPTSFENVLVLDLGEARLDECDPRVEVCIVDEATREVWAHTVAHGFSESGVITPAEESLAAVIAHRANSVRFLALVDGKPAGTGELAMTDGVGWLSADATLPAFRGRGVQTALQIARLRAALDAGCALAVSESAPGSASQRNMERRGFAVAYTRVEVVR